MSEQSQGPGWWLASDGRWYPPDQAPAVPPTDTWATPPAGPPPSRGMSTGAKVAIAVVGGFIGLIAILALAVALLGEESDTRFEEVGTAIDGDDTPDDDATPGAVEVPDGYTLIEGEGVSIAVPDGWEPVDPEDFAMTPEELQEAFPDAPEEMLEQAANAGTVLAAFDVGAAEGNNVSVIEMPVRLPLGVIERQAEAELEAVGAEDVSIEEADVPAGDALRAEYSATVAVPGGAADVVGVQYYVVTDDNAYVLTFSGPGAIHVAAEMVETFREA